MWINAGIAPRRVQQGVQLDRALGLAKGSPVEQAQTQIDRGCVQRVDGVLQIESDQVRVAVELARATNQAVQRRPPKCASRATSLASANVER